MAHPKPVTSQVYRQTIFDLAISMRPKPRVMVEIGVYSGILSRMLASVPGVESLTIIDHWLEWPNKFSAEHMEGIYQGVKEWADTDDNVHIIREDSVEAAKHFAPLTIDFWQTDGGHRYEVLQAEILTWWPKLKHGAIMCGDNYEAPSVAKAVDESFPVANIIAKGRVWWVRK